MDAILWVVIGIFAVFAIVAAVFIIRSHKNRAESNDIHMSGGADIERGYLSNDNNYFKGGYDKFEETVVIGHDYRTTCTSSKVIRLVNLRTSQSAVLNICDSIILGRSRENGCFTVGGDASVSKSHCRLLVHNGQICVEDLNSSNHTFVNSKKINTLCRLNSGDVLKIGNTKFKVLF